MPIVARFFAELQAPNKADDMPANSLAGS
jgi:hypothetical protein